MNNRVSGSWRAVKPMSKSTVRPRMDKLHSDHPRTSNCPLFSIEKTGWPGWARIVGKKEGLPQLIPIHTHTIQLVELHSSSRTFRSNRLHPICGKYMRYRKVFFRGVMRGARKSINTWLEPTFYPPNNSPYGLWLISSGARRLRAQSTGPGQFLGS